MERKRGKPKVTGDSAQVRAWAFMLGWPLLRRYTVKYKGKQLAHYISGRLAHVRLQINEVPIRSRARRGAATHEAVVFSDRFGIFTDWRQLSLASDWASTKSEARRLKDLMDYRLFLTKRSRQLFIQQQPDCYRPRVEIKKGSR